MELPMSESKSSPWLKFLLTMTESLLTVSLFCLICFVLICYNHNVVQIHDNIFVCLLRCHCQGSPHGGC